MILAHERQEAFQQEFNALLEKFGAEVDIDVRADKILAQACIEITMTRTWNSDGVVADGTTFYLDI